MFLGPSRKKPARPATPGALPGNPFEDHQPGSTDPVGAGVGSDNDLFTDALARRRRAFAHSLGETPPRDGPFISAAAGVAVAFPPKTRQEVRKETAGLNPFQVT